MRTNVNLPSLRESPNQILRILKIGLPINIAKQTRRWGIDEHVAVHFALPIETTEELTNAMSLVSISRFHHTRLV